MKYNFNNKKNWGHVQILQILVPAIKKKTIKIETPSVFDFSQLGMNLITELQKICIKLKYLGNSKLS